MKNVLNTPLIVVIGLVLGFLSASADDFKVEVGDDILYSIGGDKFIVEVIIVKAEEKLFIAETEIEGRHHTFIFEEIPDNIFNVVMLLNKKYAANRYYKKDGEFYRDSYKDGEISPIAKTNYFTKL